MTPISQSGLQLPVQSESEFRAARNQRLSMLDVINGGAAPASPSLGKKELTKPCPWCGTDPLPPKETRPGYFLFGCENDDCKINPMAGGYSASQAIKDWNARI